MTLSVSSDLAQPGGAGNEVLARDGERNENIAARRALGARVICLVRCEPLPSRFIHDLLFPDRVA